MDESLKNWSIVEGFYVPKGYPSERFTSLAELEKFVRVATDVKKAKEAQLTLKVLKHKPGETKEQYAKRYSKFMRAKEKCQEEIQ